MKTVKENTQFALATALWIGLLAATQAASTYYVATNGTGNGTTWALATSNIQAAVTSTVAGDIVLVSNGTYYCWSNSAASGYTSMVTVTKAITIQSVNGPAVTIVDANYPAITNRCFYIASGAIVSGFTITNGHASDTYGGGGVLIYNASGVVSNCWITGNSSTNGVGGSSKGGGGIKADIWDASSTGMIVNCRIYANTTTNSDGGGVTASRVVIRDCIISNNYSPNLYAVYSWTKCYISNSTIINNTGGGINLASGNDFTVDNCLISGNTLTLTVDGAGIVMSGGMVRNSWIVNNVGANRGGGVSIGGGVISNCVISSNYVGSAGGGISFANSGMAINCTIVSNRAGSYAGGVYLWRNATVRNCLIASNTANVGGGVDFYMADSYTSVVENCTIVNNRATSKGGGVHGELEAGSGRGTTINTIIVSNTAATAGDNWYTNDNRFSFTNCCTTPTVGLPGSGNISNDAAFVDYPNKNYRLLPTSPCANAAIMRDWMSDTAVDMDGHRRLDRFSGRPDMGCFELVPAGTMFRVR